MTKSFQLTRTFLFLQGPPGPFFARLGARLIQDGHRVFRINLNNGDRCDWPEGSIDYQGSGRNWPQFIDRFFVDNRVTDLILFGDCRPLHRAAHGMAMLRQLRIHVFEEGYIRPDWVTMELDGVNGHSTLPRDSTWYVEQAARLPEIPDLPNIPAEPGRRLREAINYYGNSLLGMWRFPLYQTHRSSPAIFEALGWSLRQLRTGSQEKTERTLCRLDETPHFLLPLQLSSDHQIRVHSPFDDMASALDHVIASFARQAPPDIHLVVKEHPLETGLVNWSRLIAHRAKRHGVAGRVHFVSKGNIDEMVRKARGVVTVNSTTGTLALAAGTPVKVLGKAVYDLCGITHQGVLDEFWLRPRAPNAQVYDAFCRVLLDRCLIRGGFASEEGLELLVGGALERLVGTEAIGFDLPAGLGQLA